MADALDPVPPVFTIGHSTRPLEAFLDLLVRHGVTALADVRSVPYSRWQPQFNQDSLKRAMRQREIAYVFLGKELGARTEDRSCYVDGRVAYRRLAATDTFRQGLARVVEGSGKESIALMCAEGDPLDCHRTILIARELVADGLEVQHILPDGSLEPHVETMRRLLGKLRLLQQGFFDSPESLIERAYAEQEKRIAYVDRALVAEGSSAE